MESISQILLRDMHEICFKFILKSSNNLNDIVHF